VRNALVAGASVTGAMLPLRGTAAGGFVLIATTATVLELAAVFGEAALIVLGTPILDLA
jgi:hypothetical protein